MDRGVANLTLTITMEGIDYLQRELFKIYQGTVASGIDPSVYSVHKLRHTAATLMYKYGEVDIRSLQTILGHQSVATTQIYTHVDDDTLHEAVSKNPLAGYKKES